MNDSIRQFLDIASTLSDEQVVALLKYALEQRPDAWEAALFMTERGEVEMARNWLMSRGDKKLSLLGRLLPQLMNCLHEEAGAESRRTYEISGDYIENQHTH